MDFGLSGCVGAAVGGGGAAVSRDAGEAEARAHQSAPRGDYVRNGAEMGQERGESETEVRDPGKRG